MRVPLVFAIVCLAAIPAVQGEEAYKKEIVLKPVLKTQVDGAGKKIEYPKGANAEITGVVVEIPVGAETGWHVHTIPCVAYILEGEVTVEWEDGSKRVVKAGEAFAEVINLRHNGSNKGTVPAKLVMFAIGTTETPIAVKTP